MDDVILCLDFLKVDGAGWNWMAHIPSITTPFSQFCSPILGGIGWSKKTDHLIKFKNTILPFDNSFTPRFCDDVILLPKLLYQLSLSPVSTSIFLFDLFTSVLIVLRSLFIFQTICDTFFVRF